MLVLAADLEEVEEVGGASMDLYQVSVLVRGWGRKGGYGEVKRSGDVRGYLYGSHDRKSTRIFSISWILVIKSEQNHAILLLVARSR